MRRDDGLRIRSQGGDNNGFELSDKVKKIIENDTGMTIDEIRNSTLDEISEKVKKK